MSSKFTTMSQNTLYCFVELKGTRGVVSAKANAWLSDTTSQKYSVMIEFEKICLLVMQDLIKTIKKYKDHKLQYFPFQQVLKSKLPLKAQKGNSFLWGTASHSSSGPTAHNTTGSRCYASLFL